MRTKSSLVAAAVAVAAVTVIACAGGGSDSGSVGGSKGGADPLRDDGVWTVGKEIQPGTYRSGSEPGCYYARLKATDGQLESIIDNGNGPNQTVTIAATDKAFEHRGCGGWTKQ